MILHSGLTLICLFTITSFHYTACQDDTVPIIQRSIRGPDGLAVGSFIGAVTEHEVYLGWIPLDHVYSYKLRIYRSKNFVLEREITNIHISVFFVTGLDAGTSYSATIAAIFDNSKGTLIESGESIPVTFRTRDICTGGQSWSPCNAHCIGTCEDPDPVCRRICKPGCACPINATLLHSDKCITSQECPSPKGTPVSVSGLRVLETLSQGSGILLAWEVQPGAYIYEVRVRLASNREVVIKELEVTIPIVRIQDLSPGQIYIFGVQAFIRRVRRVSTISARSGRLSSALLPPSGIIVSNVSETGFAVTWLSNRDAARYSFTLFDETENHILYENRYIAGNSVVLEELTPGTKYYFSLATAGLGEDVGPYSSLALVTTLGMKNTSINNRESIIIKQLETPATTPRPTPGGNTRCLQEYQSVEQFYRDYARTSGSPRYPICDKIGKYVTNLCQPDNPDICWCIDADDGEKKRGSDYGGENSNFPLDCDRYGVLPVDDLELTVIGTRASSITVVWTAAPGASSYIITVQNVALQTPERTIAVNSAAQQHKLDNLLAGNKYDIGIYIVDSTGGTSPLEIIQAMTDFVDTPVGLRVVSSFANNLTVTWTVDPNAESFIIVLWDLKANKAIRRQINVLDNSFTFSGLSTLKRYNVVVRAVALQYTDDPNKPRRHISAPARVETLVQCTLPAVDIIFGFDISKYATWTGLQASKALANNILESLPEIDETSPTGTRVAAMRYYRDASTIFNFGRFKKTASAIAAIRYIRYNGGQQLFTGRLLDRAATHFFANPQSSSYRVRRNALSVVVVFSLGQSQDSFKHQANRLKAFTNVMAIGVSGRSSRADMRLVASRPNLSILASSFGNLETVNDIVLQRLCTLA